MPEAPKNCHLLIAEDDEDDYFFLEEILQNQYPGIAIQWVKDGEELMQYLQALNRARPQLLLLDLNMPKKDGRQALREIKEDPALVDLRVIVFTTSNSEIDKAFVEGFRNTTFKTKPIGYPHYVAFVKSLKIDL